MIELNKIKKEKKYLYAIVSEHGFQYQKVGSHAFGPIIMRDYNDALKELEEWKKMFNDLHIVRVEISLVEPIDERR